MGFDLIADWGTGVRPGQLVGEGATAMVARGGVLTLFARLRSLGRERRELCHQLAASRDEARRWRGEAAELLDGLAAAIDRQFDRWQLTAAERDVALSLLRGLSHKQIAGVRHRKPRGSFSSGHAVKQGIRPPRAFSETRP